MSTPENTNSSLEACLREHAQAFRAHFGDSGGPVRVFFAPGRVNLMGAHLDYNGGPVMPTAIDRGTWFAARLRPDRRVRLASTLEPGERECTLDQLPAHGSGHWSDYPLGVVQALSQRLGEKVGETSGAGSGASRLSGVELLFGGNLTIGAGLSSSASICVGTALALTRLHGLKLEPRDWVDLALRAERGFVGVQCGIMDPHAIGLARAGALLWLDCRDGSHTWLPLDPARAGIAVADTRVRRQLAQSAFNERVAECRAAFEWLRRAQPQAGCLREIALETFESERARMPAVLARRAEHVLREVARTFAARRALERGDLAGFGAQMTRAHESLRTHFEVSVPQLDCLVETATALPGVLGSRLTGAGFGGCAVILFERGAETELRERLEGVYGARFGQLPKIELFGGDPGPRELLVER
ncbi:MAG: galactokinase [Planctomycetota bacterium]|jgi:galactokinase